MKFIFNFTKLTFNLKSGVSYSKFVSASVNDVQKYPWCYLSALFDWDEKGCLYTLTECENQFEFRSSEIKDYTVSSLFFPKISISK